MHSQTKPAVTSTPACTVCNNEDVTQRFRLNDAYPVWHCSQCASQFLHPQPDDEVLAAIYDADYFLGGDTEEARQKRMQMKQDTARLFLEQLQAYRGQNGGRLLEIGCGQGELLIAAEKMGYDVFGTEFSEHAAEIARDRLQNGEVQVGDITSLALPAGSFDVIINVDVIEHTRDPQAFTAAIRRLLKPGGVLMIVTISLDTWTARLLGQNWMEFKTEHLTYFSDGALSSLLARHDFGEIKLQPAYKILNPKYILDHFERYQVPLLTPLLRLGYRLLPSPLRQKSLKLTGSGVVVLARAVGA